MWRGRDCRKSALLAGSDAQLTAEWGERDRHAGQESGLTVREVRDAQRGVREVVGEEPKAGDVCGPAPVRGSEVEQLDLQAVARLGILDGDRPVDLVDAGEVKVRQVCDRRARGDLAAGRVQGVELHDRPAGNRCDGLDGSVPGEMELIASDVHRGG